MFKMNSPLDELGLGAMADWLAPRIRESPLWKMAMSDHDPELIAIMLERMIPSTSSPSNSRPPSSARGPWSIWK